MTTRTRLIAGAALALGALFPLIPAAAQNSKICDRVPGVWIYAEQTVGQSFEVVIKPGGTTSPNFPFSLGTWRCGGNVVEFGTGARLTLSPDGNRMSGPNGGILNLPATAVRKSAPPASAIASSPAGTSPTGTSSTRSPALISVATTPAQAAKLLEPPLDAPRGVYKLEQEYNFNVLDSVYYDPSTHQISLVGHRDEHFKGYRIPYLQHLATLLEVTDVRFTLEPTPETLTRVDAFFKSSMSPREADRVSTQLGVVLDGPGNVTLIGRYMLPAIGVYPIPGNKTPGYLGVETQITKDGLTAVTLVAPNSPAATAGILPGDLITYFDDGTIVNPSEGAVYHPLHLARRVRFAGAGTTLALTYQRGLQPFRKTLTLTADSKDPWLGFNRYDVLIALYRAAGDENAARVIHAMGLYNDAPKQNPALGVALANFIAAVGMSDEVKNVWTREQTQGGTSPAAVAFGRTVSQRLDEIFAFPGNPVLAAFNANLAKTGNAGPATQAAFNQFDVALKPKVGELLDRIFNRPEGIQIPPELLEPIFHVRAESTPEYRGVPANSLLARAMFDGDYLTKRLTNRPDLKLKFPTYQTEFEFKRIHSKLSSEDTAFRIWISPAKLDVAQAADGSTLEFRNVQMRFNIHKLGKNLVDLPNQQPDGYETLLNSLYDDFAQEYPTLHELREITKLTAAVAWLRGKTPSLRLPQEGRVVWRGPSKVPGLLYVYLYNRDGKNFIQDIVEGGVNLNLEPFLWPSTGVVDARGMPGAGPLPRGAPGVSSPTLGAPKIPNDPSVVDLRGLGTERLTVVPEVYQNDTLRRILRAPSVDIPVPRPVGWVAEANKGNRAIQSLSLMISQIDAACAEQGLEQRNKLEVALAIARRLKQTELALNILTQDSAYQALAFQTLQEDLIKEEAATKELVINSFRQWGHEARLRINDSEDLAETTKTWIESFNALDTIGETQGKTSGHALFLIVKDLADTWGREQAALRPVLNTVADAKLVKTMLDLAALNVKLNFLTAPEIKGLDIKQTAARDALRKKLIPLQKELSAQLDAARNDPVLKKTCGPAAKTASAAPTPPAPSAESNEAREKRAKAAINAIAYRLPYWSDDDRTVLAQALESMQGFGWNVAVSKTIQSAWQAILARPQDGEISRAASQGLGPGFPGAGTQTIYQDCTVFALANAAGLTYGIVAARAAEIIRQNEFRPAEERANPQRVMETSGLMGGETLLLAQAFGQPTVLKAGQAAPKTIIDEADFAKALSDGRSRMLVGVVPPSGRTAEWHQVVMTKTFQFKGETWYEMMDSNQGPLRRLYLTSTELGTIVKERGIVFTPDSDKIVKLLR